ncbi:MAG: hypothetical protein CR981_01945 [Proteobacteria bacterium]|nr:MAG: hypothetical protein CR981_01945 [Pseudomonadota bacterium]
MKKPTIYLFGDSLINYGDWQQLLPDCTTFSSGIPGERAEALLSRLYRTKTKEPPDIILIMTGTNNLLLYQDTRFPEIIKNIVLTLKEQYPATRFLLNSLFPFAIPGIEKVIVAINDRLKTIAVQTGSDYLDTFSPFKSATTVPFGPDDVHLNEAGYQLWARCIRQHINHRMRY